MILVINKNRREAQNCADIFYYMGILSSGVCPEEAFSEICLKYRAALVMFPELMIDTGDYVKRLRKYAGKIPIFALTADKRGMNANLFDGVYDFNILSSTLLKKITEYCRQSALPYVGSYRAGGIDASADTENVYFGGSEIILTKTEKMILRYLIRSYPTPSMPTDIIAHAFRKSRAPLATSVRTHISQMNKKFRDGCGFAPIQSVENKGYILASPKNS